MLILSLQSDIVFASNSTRFGLPEVSIGLIPGAGGTQRLTNAVGKYKVSDIHLSEMARLHSLIQRLDFLGYASHTAWKAA